MAPAKIAWFLKSLKGITTSKSAMPPFSRQTLPLSSLAVRPDTDTMAPGRDLDIAVARLLGYTVVTAHSQSRTRSEPRIPELGFKPVPRYSTRMSAAWALTEWLWRKHQVRTVIRKTGHTQVTLESFAGGSPVAQVFEKRAPQAICEAALCLFALQ